MRQVVVHLASECTVTRLPGQTGLNTFIFKITNSILIASLDNCDTLYCAYTQALSVDLLVNCPMLCHLGRGGLTCRRDLWTTCSPSDTLKQQRLITICIWFVNAHSHKHPSGSESNHMILPGRWSSWSLRCRCRRAAACQQHTGAFHEDWAKRGHPGNRLRDAVVYWEHWSSPKTDRSNTH